jgi:hypothetical protein
MTVVRVETITRSQDKLVDELLTHERVEIDRVREEVVVRKQSSNRVETVRDTVRREDVEITKSGATETDSGYKRVSMPLSTPDPWNTAQPGVLAPRVIGLVLHFSIASKP